MYFARRAIVLVLLVSNFLCVFFEYVLCTVCIVCDCIFPLHFIVYVRSIIIFVRSNLYSFLRCVASLRNLFGAL